mgnify:CR=1 FL=1
MNTAKPPAENPPMTDLAFLWHMHQPDYRHPENGQFVLPWVLLHAIKDYADMAGHLERHPHIKCTVNFVPVLLDQVEDYCDQFATRHWRDPLLAVAASGHADDEQRRWLLDMAFRGHAATLIEPFAPYRRLRDIREFMRQHGASGHTYLGDAYFSDLACWMLLAWSGETLRRANGIIPRLMAKGEDFDAGEREALLATLGEVVRQIIPRYRALAASGQVEISCTPSHHPLAPLMLDFASAREAWHDCRLPSAPAYPGGRTRVAAHLATARASHERRFGQAAAGLWPAEGALSMPFLGQIGEAGFTWAATSHSVLRNSAGPAASPYRPWQAPDSPLTLFFRDERLSDLIGFEYSRWHGRDAARHFVAEAERIAGAEPGALIPVFLDGENAWEYYPYNAWYFFDDLYAALGQAPGIRTVTLSEAAARHAARRPPLAKLTAGSWVYGTFSTWIGHPDKNRAWELLCEAKLSADRVLANPQLAADERQAILDRLAVCESSDWFWWFGDDNPAPSVVCFDQLFRANLKALYGLLNLPAPARLNEAISRGGGEAEAGGTMRRAG